MASLDDYLEVVGGANRTVGIYPGKDPYLKINRISCSQTTFIVVCDTKQADKNSFIILVFRIETSRGVQQAVERAGDSNGKKHNKGFEKSNDDIIFCPSFL